MSEKENFSLESNLKTIREIVDKMQLSNLDFDENVRLFTEGTEMIKACRDYLDESELLIKKLLDGPEGPIEEDFEEA